MHCRGVESLPEEFPILFCLRLEDNYEMLYYIIILIPCSIDIKDLCINFYQIFLSNFGVLHASIRAEKIINFAKIGQFW